MIVCLLRVLYGHIENITAAASTQISHIGNKWRILRIHVDLVAVHVLDFNFGFGPECQWRSTQGNGCDGVVLDTRTG